MPTMVNRTGKHRPKRRHHGDGTVVRRKDRWRAKPWAAVVPYIDPSGRRRETWLSAASRAEAEVLLAAELAKRRKVPVRSGHTVGSYVTDWLQHADLSPWAYDRYRNHVELRILPTLGAVPLGDVNPPTIRAAMAQWSGAAATRMGTFVVLRTALRQALTDRMLERDPTEGIRAPRPQPTTPDVLDVVEARHLMDTVRGERFAPILAVSLGLGLRRGEALGLRTPDIDIPARTLTIRHSLRRVPVSTRVPGEEWWRLVAPKRDSGATVPLPDFVAEALAARLVVRDQEQRAAKVWAANDLVFSDAHGGPVPLQTLNAWFKGALRRAGLPDMRWHELRSSTATMLLAEGINEVTVMQILRHRSLEMTRRYVKLLPRVSRAAADAMNERLG